MRFFLALAALTAPLFAQCSYSVDQNVFNVGAGSATAVIRAAVIVTTTPDCAWTAKSNVSWISVFSGVSGTGKDTVGFFVDRNPTQAARTGTLFIAGQAVAVTVNQAGAVCDYSLSPPSINFPVTGGPGTVEVTASCIWATNSSPWITIPPNTQGTFDGKFSYTVAPNPCVSSRSGAIAVGITGVKAQQLPVTQDGSPSNLSLSPATATVGAALTDGKITVSTGDGCAWSAFSDVSWLQIVSAPSASGTNNLSYRAAANPSATRTGSIHVGSQIFTLTQLGSGPPPAQLTAVTNAASYEQGGVSPGEIVTLFGSNMGPAVLVKSDGNPFTKALGGVQVFFDGSPAALIYVSAVQISAVVPYAVAGTFNTNVHVEYQGASSNVLSLPVQNASPGLFTLDASGRGAGAILNQDFSINANANRAARGSVVQIYCTGGGVTNPASTDASITGTPLPRLTESVSVLIGGSIAEVQYSGGAPGSIAGLTQINVVVPAGVIPGPALEVLVGIGAWRSQPGVTLAVK